MFTSSEKHYQGSRARAPFGRLLAAAFALSIAGFSANTARADITLDLAQFTGLPKIIGGCILPNNGGIFTGLFVMQGRTVIGGFVIGDPGLPDNLRFLLGAGNDNLWVANQVTSGSITPVNGCAQFGPPVTNGFAIGLEGQDGSDVLTCGGAICTAKGGNGNDTVYCGNSSAATLVGEAGNDIVWSCQRSGTETLSGGNDNDALCKSGGETGFSVASGGPGTDCSTLNFGNLDVEQRASTNQCNGRCSTLQ